MSSSDHFALVRHREVELETSSSNSQSIQLSMSWPVRLLARRGSSDPENRIVCLPKVRGFDLRFVPKHILRKEVIQPQVPLRLPCYDFTPVTNHSLGACLPCGLAQPLLEQSTPMV